MKDKNFQDNWHDEFDEKYNFYVRYLEHVKEFHEMMMLPIKDHPNEVNREDFELRIHLIAEELDEMRDSLMEFDYNKDDNGPVDWRISLLDALCDLQYVISGAVLQLGFHKVFDDAFLEVHKSNMSKIHTYKDTDDLIRETRHLNEKYGQGNWEYVTVGPYDKKAIVKRLSDGKILKPSGYRPVNLRGFTDILDDI